VFEKECIVIGLFGAMMERPSSPPCSPPVSMTPSKKEIATYTLAGGLFAVAIAIGYFGYVLTQINASLPGILDEVQVTQDKFEPVLNEVTEIRLLVPGIVEEVELVRQTISPFIDEVGLIREQIPGIMEEVRHIRRQIPEITTDVDAIVAQIPPILEEVAAIRTETIPPLLAEVASIRTETIPPIIDRVEAIHEDMPGYFDRADRLVAEARVAGQQASEGAVSGLFTGIIKAPLSLVSGVGNALGRKIEATDEDRKLALRAAEIVLQSDIKGTSETFENPKTEFTGTITLRSVRKIKGTVHKTLRLVTHKKGKKLAEVDVEVAVSVGGTWEPIKTTDR
jgi:uncharacterized protein YoxC